MKILLFLLRALAAYPRFLLADTADFLSTVQHYYPNRRFRRADLLCLRAYLLRNPDAICLRHLRRQPHDRVQKMYGETYFSTLDTIARAVGLSEQDVVYELGCGRGRGVFWFNAFYGCRTIGVELNPVFVQQAQAIRKKVHADGVQFVMANLMDVDYSDATLLYLYGTAFSDDAIYTLVERFAALKPGVRIASVSYSLTEYAAEIEPDGQPMFVLEQTLPVRFVWGNTDVYIQRRL